MKNNGIAAAFMGTLGRSFSGSFSSTAALLSDPGRAGMVTALMGGIALPAGQLAMIASVAPQTASSHLARLVAGRLLRVERQGRHRYYRLADDEVAHAVEALMAIAPRPSAGNGAAHWASTGAGDHATSAREAMGGLAFARTCYSHLAGHLGVQLAEGLLQREYLRAKKGRAYGVSERGREWFRDFGIAISDARMRNPRFARRCLDWTERRHHLAGQLGSALLGRLRDLRWVVGVRDSRAVRITAEGERGLRRALGIEIPRAH